MEAQRLYQSPVCCFLELRDYLESSGLMSSSAKMPFPSSWLQIAPFEICPREQGNLESHLPWSQLFCLSPPSVLRRRQTEVLASDIYTSLNALPTPQTSLNECAVQLLPPALCFRSSDTHLFDKVRGYDIKLLRYLSVKYICDLMVENKKVKFGMK